MKIKKVIIWFTGIPGSGKTVLSSKFYAYLKRKNKKIQLIDGDIFRKKIKNFKYDLLNRKKVGEKKIRMANKYYDKGYIVLVSGIAHKKKLRNDLRKFAGERNYEEIYLKSSINVCLKRKKQLNDYNKIFKNKYQDHKNYNLKINTEKELKSSFNKLKNYILHKHEIR